VYGRSGTGGARSAILDDGANFPLLNPKEARMCASFFIIRRS